MSGEKESKDLKNPYVEIHRDIKFQIGVFEYNIIPEHIFIGENVYLVSLFRFEKGFSSTAR